MIDIQAVIRYQSEDGSLHESLILARNHNKVIRLRSIFQEGIIPGHGRGLISPRSAAEILVKYWPQIRSTVES